MLRKNSTGRQVAYWRYQNKWTQKTLAARLQCLGFDISREMLANIEVGSRGVEDNWLVAFQRVFHIPIIRLFPPEVQGSDLEYGERIPTPSPDPGSLKKSQRKCQKLTKQRKRA
jgi:transcriptional regulator with XRE-family HTH domain